MSTPFDPEEVARANGEEWTIPPNVEPLTMAEREALMARHNAIEQPDAPPRESEDFSTSRDASALLTGARNILESIEVLIREIPNRDAYQRQLVQQQLAYAQKIITRARIVLTVTPPFDTETDWLYVEEAERKYQERSDSGLLDL